MYRIFLGDTQKFLIEKIARIEKESENATGEAADPAFVQKKLVGGALETAGLFAMHFSPLWVFAIAGDAAAGSSVFLDRLVNQLKSNGVIPLDASISGLTDLLAAVQTTASQSASAIDTPPMSRDELGKLATEMTANYGKMFTGVTDLVPRFETLWGQMEKLASRDNISIETLGGILTVDVADWAKKGVGAVSALGQTGTDLFGEMILDSYARTLDAVTEEGVAGLPQQPDETVPSGRGCALRHGAQDLDRLARREAPGRQRPDDGKAGGKLADVTRHARSEGQSPEKISTAGPVMKTWLSLSRHSNWRSPPGR